MYVLNLLYIAIFQIYYLFKTSLNAKWIFDRALSARSSQCCGLALSRGLVLHIGLTSLHLTHLDRIVREKLLWWAALPPMKIYYFLLFLVCFLLLIYAYSVKPEIESVFGCFCFVCFRCYLPYREDDHDLLNNLIGPLHDLVTWYGVNYARTLIAQWDFQNNETCVPSKLIPYHVTGSCKGPNGLYHFNSLIFYSFAIVGLRQSFWSLAIVSSSQS